jgi:LysM repeat protein
MDGTRARGLGAHKAALILLVLLLLCVGGCARRQARPTAAETRALPTLPAGTQAARRGEPTPTALSEAGPGLQLQPVQDAGQPDAGMLPEPSPPPQVYTVVAGDTLSAIARRFGCDIQALVSANQLADPNALRVGQQLRIPTAEAVATPAAHLLPNSEFVNGPAYVTFDTEAFAAKQGGYLASYTEWVGGETLSGPEIVDLVAHHYSVGPRLLLAIMELRSGWVTNPSPTGQALSLPVGYNRAGGGLHQQLAWVADQLNRGYYDWRGRGVTPLSWAGGAVSHYPPDLNAATAGLYYFFSLGENRQGWEVLVGSGPGSFLETYRRLFGDPTQYAVEPLIGADAASPELVLPWAWGENWFYTGGPHGAWNDGSAWAAVDFVPDEGYLGCQAASAWARAAADGLVVDSREGEVTLDLDGDGHEQTGWVLFYLHLATTGRATVGTHLEQGDPVGHPSCEGGFSESTHLHFARKYNGEWIAADGPLPLILSGWQFYSDGSEYDGTAVRGKEKRVAAEARDASLNGLVADR